MTDGLPNTVFVFVIGLTSSRWYLRVDNINNTKENSCTILTFGWKSECMCINTVSTTKAVVMTGFLFYSHSLLDELQDEPAPF